jgi:16S rRNA G966 N2-methylase RsmD
VVAVERDPRVAANLTRRGRALGAQWQVYTRDVMRFAPQLDPFQVVFVDPPYDKPIEPVLTALAPCTTDWLVAEVRANQNPPKQVGACQLVRERRYGHSALWLYRATIDERVNQGEIA